MSKVLIEKIATFSGHSDCVYRLTAAADKDSFYSAGGDGNVVHWHLNKPEEGKIIAKVDSSIYALCYLPERRWLVIGQNFEGIHIINVDNNSLVKSINVSKAAIFDIEVIDNQLILACGDGEVIIIELTNFTTVARLKLSDKSARCIKLIDNQNIFVGFSDLHIRKINLSKFSTVKQWKAHDNSVFSLDYYKKENTLLSVGRDAQIRLWDLATDFEESKTIPAHMYAINHICFSPDQTLFASCSMDKAIKIWDSNTKELIKVIDKSKYPAHGTSINRLLWNSNDILLCCSDDRSITAWKLRLN